MTEPNKRLVERIFQEARFISSLGIELTGFGHGWCEKKVAVSPVLEQQHGFVHGAVLMAIADHACGGAAASTLPEDKEGDYRGKQGVVLAPGCGDGFDLPGGRFAHGKEPGICGGRSVR
jgi:acyl-coenzyme A thioesterase PaaI-like protein